MTDGAVADGSDKDDETTETAVTSEAAAGVVVRAGRGLYIVQTDDGRAVSCRLRGNLKKRLTYPKSSHLRQRVERVRKLQQTDPVAVGDRVNIEIDPRTEGGVIETVEPRRTELSRRSGNERERQTLVANLELAVIVFAAADPRLDPWKLDRFLILAEDAELDVLIIVNKCDLVPPEDIAPDVESFRQIGYDVLLTSSQTGQGIDELRNRLRDRISAFCGPSGVGKSSLLNAIQPGLRLKTGEVGDVTHLGRHTTVQAELLSLIGGGWVADTPGLRQIEFWDLPAEDVPFCFPEMAPLAGHCRFADCRHRNEPGCAIRAAVERGEIQQRRYESFLQMTG